jgi:hypothetical protein
LPAAEQQEKDMTDAYVPQEVIQAYKRLIQLNMESWKPEVNDWLHSEDAAPELAELLAAVPCSITMH